MFMQNKFGILGDDKYALPTDEPNIDEIILHCIECHAYGNAKHHLDKLSVT